MVLKVLTEQRIFNTLKYTKKKGTREFKLKILRIFCDSLIQSLTIFRFR